MNVGKISCAPLKPQAYANSPSFGDLSYDEPNFDEVQVEQALTDFYSGHRENKSSKLDNALVAIALGGIGALTAKKTASTLLDLSPVTKLISKATDGVSSLNIGNKISNITSTVSEKLKSKIKPEGKLNKVVDVASDLTEKASKKIAEGFSKITKAGIPSDSEISSPTIVKNTIKNAGTVAGAALGVKTALKDSDENGVSDVKQTITAFNTVSNLVSAMGIS